MANAIRGNKIYIDSTGSVTTTRTKVAHILFTPDAASDQMILRESSSDSDCFIIRGATAKETIHISMEQVPMVFSNGIYVQTLTSGAKAVIVTTQGGG
jgi:hypothetical protein